MNIQFQDLQNERNPHNGEVIGGAAVRALLEELRGVEPPFMCQFTGGNGFNLIVGIARDFGCVQHAANDGMPPFLMAVSASQPANRPANRPAMEFLVGDTPTPVAGRYRISFDAIREIVAEFVSTGQRSRQVAWEELDPAD
jgi:hypothetical protein